MIKHTLQQRGVTLAEVVVTVAIVAVVGVAVATFQKDVFSLNTALQGSLGAQFEATRVLKTAMAEMRSMSQSGAGAYPIAQAATSTITFYGDIDNDGQKEKVRYFLQNESLKKGVVEPSGNPVVYTGTEKVESLINYVRNGTSTPVFDYYNSSYSGTTSPLSIPVDVLAVRLVKVTVIIDKDTARPPGAIVSTSQVSLRNLKDNL